MASRGGGRTSATDRLLVAAAHAGDQGRVITLAFVKVSRSVPRLTRPARSGPISLRAILNHRLKRQSPSRPSREVARGRDRSRSADRAARRGDRSGDDALESSILAGTVQAAAAAGGTGGRWPGRRSRRPRPERWPARGRAPGRSGRRSANRPWDRASAAQDSERSHTAA